MQREKVVVKKHIQSHAIIPTVKTPQNILHPFLVGEEKAIQSSHFLGPTNEVAIKSTYVYYINN